MSLPKRVQADLTAAEALETQYIEQRATHRLQGVQSAADLVQPAANEPPSEPPQPAPEPSAPAASPKPDFEQQYRTLQGMYAADVVAVKRSNGEMATQLRELGEQIKSLRQAPAAPTPASTADPQDIENFGAELIQMVQRYVERRTTELEGRITALEATVNGVTQQAAATQEDAFYATLTQLVPQWREINVDPRWLAWLGEVDPVYGAPRQAALDHGFGKWDASRVSAVFKAFVKSLPAAAPPPPSLADQQAPSAVASVVPVSAPPKPFISEKAIMAFYRDLGRGNYVGREAEAERLEAEINAAVAEGRVR